MRQNKLNRCRNNDRLQYRANPLALTKRYLGQQHQNTDVKGCGADAYTQVPRDALYQHGPRAHPCSASNQHGLAKAEQEQSET